MRGSCHLVSIMSSPLYIHLVSWSFVVAMRTPQLMNTSSKMPDHIYIQAHRTFWML